MPQWSPKKQVTHVRVETEITHEEGLITDELKALVIRHETEEYLSFNKVDQRKLRDLTKQVNAVIRHTGTDDITQTNKPPMTAALAAVE